MNRVKIIAEAGVNHNGSLGLAKLLVDKAVEAGADIVKFQTFKSEKMVSKSAKQAEYQQKNIGKSSGSQLDMPVSYTHLDVYKRQGIYRQ